MTRKEHLDWCKTRALEYVERGDVQNAYVSMASDLSKHPETEGHAAISLDILRSGLSQSGQTKGLENHKADAAERTAEPHTELDSPKRVITRWGCVYRWDGGDALAEAAEDADALLKALADAGFSIVRTNEQAVRSAKLTPQQEPPGSPSAAPVPQTSEQSATQRTL